MTKLAATTPADAVTAFQFRVDSIAQAPAPDGGDGLWHRYVITQGPNTITGLRAGTRAEVGTLVDGMVEALNERRMGKQPQGPKGAGRRNRARATTTTTTQS
jgi:hypothetical protein